MRVPRFVPPGREASRRCGLGPSVSCSVSGLVGPAVLGYGDPARTNDRILGPIVAGLAFVAIWPVMRPLRWVDLLVGAWLFAAPWLLGYGTGPAINSLVVGLLLMVLAML